MTETAVHVLVKEKTHNGKALSSIQHSVDELKKRLPIKSNKRIPGDPYLILYSYYIPCACIPTCNFNCAEELGKFARLHSKDMFTIVGYSAVYKRTDNKNAEVFMKEGGISMFQDLTEKNERFDAVNVITNTNGKPMNGTFQELLQQCLIGDPVSSCIPVETRERIVTAFINYIMLPWFNASMYFGKLSRMSKKDLLKSLETKLTHSIRKVSCDKMRRTPKKCRFLIKDCVESALDQTHSLAYPTFGAIRHDKPIEDTVYWRNAEALSRGFYFVNDFVEVPDCDNKLHSITSLCISEAETNCENGYNTLPDRTGREFNNEEQNRLRGASGVSLRE
ncbi:hypothetical protein MAR_035580 [Mya arenaria]|uniref:Uncharacterized protein n=1 Tax=Mya arenaria TaxID=6604 RepID=A0ABY7EQ16_MYAAR|nr:hypothetical protein MAR_035580 [Mya arenaria]